MTKSLLRGWLWCLLAFLGAASPSPAAPANDSCAGAMSIPGAGPFPHYTPLIDITDATISPSDPSLSNPFLSTRVAKSVWYIFTPTASAVYTITTCTDAGTATSVADTILSVYTSSGGCLGPFTAIGELGDEDCGPNTSQAAVSLPLTADTTYYIVVWKYCDNCTDDGLNILQLLVNGSVAPPNDTCSGAQPIPLNLPVLGSTVGATDNLRLSGTNGFWTHDQILSTAAGREVFYSFTAPTAGEYSFKVLNYDFNQDLVLYLLPSCPGAGNPAVVSNALSVANRSRVNSAEEILCYPMTAGQRVLVVVDDHNASSAGSTFTAEVIRCVREREPNNSPEEASPLLCGIEGAISPASDLDFFVLGQFPAGWRVFALVDGEAAKNPDFDLRVTSVTNTLEYDEGDNDVAFGASSPNIAGTPLTDEPAYLLVSYNRALFDSAPYRLYAVVQPPLSRAVEETEPNNDLDRANLDEGNYFFGTVQAQDTDWYAFGVSEGDLIFLSLDGDPHRTNSPINARLELLDSTGSQLLVVDDATATSMTNGPALFSPTSPGEGLVYRSPVEGTFYARVSISPNAAGTAAAGDYLLSISKNCLAGALGQNHAPLLTNLAPATPFTAGASNALSGIIWEPDVGDPLTLTVAWGDGTTNTVNYPASGRIQINVPRMFPTPTNLTVTVTVKDRAGAMDVKTVPLVVHPPGTAAQFRGATMLENDRIRLLAQGTAAAVYRVERSSDMVHWTELAVLVADSTGRFEVEDAAPPSSSHFYRIVAQ